MVGDTLSADILGAINANLGLAIDIGSRPSYKKFVAERKGISTSLLHAVSCKELLILIERLTE